MSGTTEPSSPRCMWADGAPAGLSDAAEGWGMTKLADVFQRAHARMKHYDDGHGSCRVCGSPLFFEAWLDEQAAQEKADPDRD